MIVLISINGGTSYFPCQKPTRSEFEGCDVLRIDFTEEAPDWDPSGQDFAESEVEMMDFREALVEEAVM